MNDRRKTLHMFSKVSPTTHTFLRHLPTAMHYKAPVPVTVGSVASIYRPSTAEIVSSNPTGGVDIPFECCVLSGRGLCDGMITRLGEF